MRILKDSPQALVTLFNNGNVHKVYRGLGATERFINEACTLMYLQDQECPLVPRLRRIDMPGLAIEMTHVGNVVERLNEKKVAALFNQLEDFGVIHDDPFLRNITYEPRAGQFFIIDFEYAKLKSSNKGFTQEDLALLAQGSRHKSRMEKATLT